MSRYALIINGSVYQLFETDGNMAEMWPPAMVWINIDDKPYVEPGWLAEQDENGVWQFRPWEISPEEILRINTLDKQYRENSAYQAMAESLLGAKICYYDNQGTNPVAKEWQQYWADLQAVDLTIENTRGVITVPSGYSTDFASIKVMHNIVLFPLFALLSGYGNYAATVHDYLYETRMFDRKTCDDVFYRALRAEGIAKWRAWIFWAGVRLGGRKAYNS